MFRDIENNYFEEPGRLFMFYMMFMVNTALSKYCGSLKLDFVGNMSFWKIFFLFFLCIWFCQDFFSFCFAGRIFLFYF